MVTKRATFKEWLKIIYLPNVTLKSRSRSLILLLTNSLYEMLISYEYYLDSFKSLWLISIFHFHWIYIVKVNFCPKLKSYRSKWPIIVSTFRYWSDGYPCKKTSILLHERHGHIQKHAKTRPLVKNRIFDNEWIGMNEAKFSIKSSYIWKKSNRAWHWPASAIKI